MSMVSPINSKASSSWLAKTLISLLLVGLIFAGSVAVLWLSSASGASLGALFAIDTVQAWWYVTRAAGLTAYFLLWLSMVWGMAVSTRLLQPVVHAAHSYDFHEFLSLLGLGFALLHIVVLPFDKFLPFTLLQVLIPFTDTYRPLWVGLGIIGFYIFLLVTVTFYIRSSIGPKAFRTIHILSLLGYLDATAHGLFAGTDSALGITRMLYAGTFLIVIFLTVYWLVMLWLTRREKAAAEARARWAARQPHRLRPSHRP
jgi:predicted ferric reductase